MHKIMIIGSPGSGKSTFARKLRDATDLPLYYLDMIYHRADGTSVSREEFDGKLSELTEKNEWIIDGNYNRTLEMRFEKCDTVFLFDIPTDVCLQGAESRIGKVREDLPWVENEFDEEFKQFIIEFPENKLPKIYHLIEKYEHDVHIVIFKSREESEAFINKLKK